MARPIITIPIRKVNSIPSGVQSVEIVYTGIVKSVFFDEAAVAYNVPTELASFIVPFSKFNGVLRVDVTGQNTAVYDILINGDQVARTRTSYFNTFSNTILFGNGPGDALTLSAGTEMVVMVTNLVNSPSDFECRIQYLET